MKYFLLFLLLTGVCTRSFAQTEIAFPFISDDDNRIIKETDSGKYFVASGDDTTKIIFINDETMACKVLSKERKLLVAGSLIANQDKYMQDGKWTEYYDNGKVKCRGYYYKSHPLGLWEQFYANGKPERAYNYSTISEKGDQYYCLSGSYKEYYESGQLKTNGFYEADMDGKGLDTVYVTDPVTNQTLVKVLSEARAKPEKIGRWEYYSENGELDKKEDYQ